MTELALVEPLAPSGLPCAAAGGCPNPAEVQWLRRHPDEPDSTDTVRACRGHAITLDAAAHVHQATCPAPDPAHLPACGCIPEPLPTSAPPAQDTVTLPTGWTLPT